MPSKIAFTIWRIFWDFIPNFANLIIRRVVTNDRCPRCRSKVEGSLHVFRDCPMTTEVWYLKLWSTGGHTKSQDPF
ncbi:hypothetical protein Goshw_010960 [Gossypium schwendimanii]|uniref:Reverse transcriptase zinc-binding domain-containing protein n=1 Tax=Gossypium schwendimanii TaxID=34291 RepID=A0A7J9N3Q3_GOSSC|nr:hypothetical protein [Gossypium schwendimanii]